jgi:hypothetical protein
VTSADIYRSLDAPLDPPPPLPDDELADHLLRHVLNGAAVLDVAGRAYRELLSAKAEGAELAPEDVLELAGAVAAIIQSAWRRREMFASIPDAKLRPAELFEALGQLLDSLVLLTDPDQRVDELPLTVEEIDELLELPVLRELLGDDDLG